MLLQLPINFLNFFNNRVIIQREYLTEELLYNGDRLRAS